MVVVTAMPLGQRVQTSPGKRQTGLIQKPQIGAANTCSPQNKPQKDDLEPSCLPSSLLRYASTLAFWYCLDSGGLGRGRQPSPWPCLFYSTDGDYLATCDNYHLTRKNDSYQLVIWNGHLWGERFQTAAMGECQGTDGNGRDPLGSKGWRCSGYGKLISSTIVTTNGGRSPSGGGEIFLRNGVGRLCFGDNRQG